MAASVELGQGVLRHALELLDSARDHQNPTLYFVHAVDRIIF